MGKIISVICGPPSPLRYDVAERLVRKYGFLRVDGYALQEMLGYRDQRRDREPNVKVNGWPVPLEDDINMVLKVRCAASGLIDYGGRVLVTNPTRTQVARDSYFSAVQDGQRYLVYVAARDEEVLGVDEIPDEPDRFFAEQCTRLKPEQLRMWKDGFEPPEEQPQLDGYVLIGTTGDHLADLDTASGKIRSVFGEPLTD